MNLIRKFKGNQSLRLTRIKRKTKNIQARTFNVIRRTEKWFRDQKFRKGSLMSTHELRVGSHAVTQLPISISNKIVDVAGDTKPVVE